jgi:hypothetical protein
MIEFLLIVIIILLCPLLQRILGAGNPQTK